MTESVSSAQTPGDQVLSVFIVAAPCVYSAIREQAEACKAASRTDSQLSFVFQICYSRPYRNAHGLIIRTTSVPLSEKIMNHRSYLQGVVVTLVAAISWGGMFPVMTSALKVMNAFLFTAFRYTGAAVEDRVLGGVWSIEVGGSKFSRLKMSSGRRGEINGRSSKCSSLVDGTWRSF